MKERKILSFDIGIHHFAFVLMQVFDETQWNIIHMECHDFHKNEKLYNIVMNQDFWNNFHHYIVTNDKYIQKADIILIEKQLGFGKQINYKANQISSQLYAHLILFYPDKEIIEYPSSFKTKFFDFKSTNKKDRKNWSVQKVYSLLEERNDETSLEWLNTFPKKDDICDCVLMNLSFMKQYF